MVMIETIYYFEWKKKSFSESAHFGKRSHSCNYCLSLTQDSQSEVVSQSISKKNWTLDGMKILKLDWEGTQMLIGFQKIKEFLQKITGKYSFTLILKRAYFVHF